MTDCPTGFDGIDMDDPSQHLAWALGSMPSHQPGGIPVPIPPKSVPVWSKLLYDLGFRHHPDEQRLFPVASQHPGLGWLSPITWVERAEYDQRTAETAEKAENLRRAVADNPDMAAMFAAMADPEKRAQLAQQAHDLHGRIQQIQQEHGGTQ